MEAPAAVADHLHRRRGSRIVDRARRATARALADQDDRGLAVTGLSVIATQPLPATVEACDARLEELRGARRGLSALSGELVWLEIDRVLDQRARLTGAPRPHRDRQAA